MSQPPAPLPVPSAPTASPQGRASAREFLAVVFRRKWIILGLFGVTMATVVAVALTTPVIYTSSGRVLVKRGERETSLTPYRQVFNQWEEELGSEVEIVRSYPVLQRARQILATEHPNEHLEIQPGSVDAEVMGKSNVLGIAYTDLNGHVAQRVADALVRAYIEYRQLDPTLRYPQAFFSGEQNLLDAQIRRLEDQKRAYSERSGALDVSEQQRDQLNNLGVFEQRRSDLDQQLAEARVQARQMQVLQSNPDVDLPTTADIHDLQFTNESALQELKRKIVDQQGRIAELRERYTEEAPEVKNALGTLATLKGLLKKEVAARFALVQGRITALEARRAQMAKDIAGVREDLARMPERERMLSEFDRQIYALRLRYEDLVKKINDAKAAASTTEPATVILLSPAGPPTPHNTRDYVRLALAPAFSIVVGIGLAFFVDGLDLTVRTAGQAEEALDLPVLAAVNERRRRRRAG